MNFDLGDLIRTIRNFGVPERFMLWLMGPILGSRNSVDNGFCRYCRVRQHPYNKAARLSNSDYLRVFEFAKRSSGSQGFGIPQKQLRSETRFLRDPLAISIASYGIIIGLQ